MGGVTAAGQALALGGRTFVKIWCVGKNFGGSECCFSLPALCSLSYRIEITLKSCLSLAWILEARAALHVMLGL